MRVFIEFWKAKETWYQMSKTERANYVDRTGALMKKLMTEGLIIVDAWGMNEDVTAQRADYDFFAVTKMPSVELLLQFQDILEEHGWYKYFDQINMSGKDVGVEQTTNHMINLEKEELVIEKNI